GVGDLVLHLEYVGESAVVALSPQLTASGDVVELRGDAHAVTAPAHAALDQIADPELLGDLSHGHGFALIGEGGLARDDKDPAHRGERGDDVVADTVGKIVLLGLAAHVEERKDGNGGPIGSRRSRL